MCDGLGACLGYCPRGAIMIEKREAEPYQEEKVMEIMVKKGKATVIAHLKHLFEHNESEYFEEGMNYLRHHEDELDFGFQEVMDEFHGKISHPHHDLHIHEHSGRGCPGSKAMTIERPVNTAIPGGSSITAAQSELRQWPVQMHLINPKASYFRNADVVIAADCTAFAMGDFHQNFLKGKSLAIACPKLDSNIQDYTEKITEMIDSSQVNTITVMVMQVPCCRGLLQIVQEAVSVTRRKVPVKLMVVSIEGNILQEEWI